MRGGSLLNKTKVFSEKEKASSWPPIEWKEPCEGFCFLRVGERQGPYNSFGA
uniref:Uncharacterized protein n=1 Tax=Lepeophtheirus salmonis TaxID=72036 RepID=A0A0K2V6I1_LEPSM